MNDQRRTDLALEARDLYEERSGAPAPGVSSRQRLREGYEVTDVRVESEQGAAAVGKAPSKEVEALYDTAVAMKD